MLSHADLSSGTNQAFPFVGIAQQLPREQNFNTASKKVSGRGIARTHRLRPHATATAVKPRGKHPSVVEYHQVAGAQKVRKIAELSIFEATVGQGSRTLPDTTLQMQQARAGTIRQRLLRNQFCRQFVMEIGDQHAFRL